MTADELRGFAQRYAQAWCSQDAASVAAFFSPAGSLAINGGAPSQGRGAITAAAQDFMTTFPDLHVAFDELRLEDELVVFHWTLDGTTQGRGVRISGFEQWTFGADGLIESSLGHFDADDYARQLAP